MRPFMKSKLKSKRTMAMAQVVICKHKALSLIPSLERKEKIPEKITKNLYLHTLAS
jgi:hypothetical protein